MMIGATTKTTITIKDTIGGVVVIMVSGPRTMVDIQEITMDIPTSMAVIHIRRTPVRIRHIHPPIRPAMVIRLPIQVLTRPLIQVQVRTRPPILVRTRPPTQVRTRPLIQVQVRTRPPIQVRTRPPIQVRTRPPTQVRIPPPTQVRTRPPIRLRATLPSYPQRQGMVLRQLCTEG